MMLPQQRLFQASVFSKLQCLLGRTLAKILHSLPLPLRVQRFRDSAGKVKHKTHCCTVHFGPAASWNGSWLSSHRWRAQRQHQSQSSGVVLNPIIPNLRVTLPFWGNGDGCCFLPWGFRLKTSYRLSASRTLQPLAL